MKKPVLPCATHGTPRRCRSIQRTVPTAREGQRNILKEVHFTPKAAAAVAKTKTTDCYVVWPVGRVRLVIFYVSKSSGKGDHSPYMSTTY